MLLLLLLLLLPITTEPMSISQLWTEITPSGSCRTKPGQPLGAIAGLSRHEVLLDHSRITIRLLRKLLLLLLLLPKETIRIAVAGTSIDDATMLVVSVVSVISVASVFTSTSRGEGT